MIKIVNIKGSPGYKISSLGIVYNKHMVPLVPSFSDSGYLAVKLYGVKLIIHRLVALAFIPNPNNKEFVNHKNGVKFDNWKGNLEWVTNSENMIHAVNTGLVTYSDQLRINAVAFGSRKSRAVLKISPNGDILDRFDSVKSAMRSAGYQIKCALSGRYKTSHGLTWKYEDLHCIQNMKRVGAKRFN